MSTTKSLADRMKAGIAPADKFKAADTAMASGTLLPAMASPEPVAAVAVKASVLPAKTAPAEGSVIRENFSLPPADSALIDALRKRVAVQGVLLNRSEVLRAGLAALSALNDVQLGKVAGLVPKMKSGRPKATA